MSLLVISSLRNGERTREFFTYDTYDDAIAAFYHSLWVAVSIPYYVAEGMSDRLSATNKRLWILCILLIVLLVGSNGLWIWYESQFMYYVQSVDEYFSRSNTNTKYELFTRNFSRYS